MSGRKFNVRFAGTEPNDAEFIVASFDSTLPPLAAAGNSGMWGTQPFSQKVGFLETTRQDVIQSEKFRLTGEGEKVRLFIVEVEVDNSVSVNDSLHTRQDAEGRLFLSVGAAQILEDHFPKHLHSVDNLRPQAAKIEAEGKFLLLDYLMTDHRAGPERKGAGAALVEHIKKLGRQIGKNFIFAEVWVGSTTRLST